MFHSEFDLTLYWVLSQLSVLYHFGEKILEFDSHLIFTSKTGKQRSTDVLFRLRVVALCPIATVSFATVSTAASTAPARAVALPSCRGSLQEDLPSAWPRRREVTAVLQMLGLSGRLP